MTQQLFDRELQYQTMMVVCRILRSYGTFSDKDIVVAEFLLNEKYRITRVQPVDMFPHTQHVENVVRLEKIEQ